MAVGTYALCSLAELKAHLGITTSTDDSIMEAYIDEATARIESWIGRRIISRSYSEWYGGNNVRAIALRQYPINSVLSVRTGFAAAMTIVSDTPSDLAASVSIDSSPEGILSSGLISPRVILTRMASDGTSTASALAMTTYPTVSLLAAAITALTGYTASVVTNMPTSFLHPRASADIKAGTVTLSAANVSSEYTYDSRTGIVTIRQDPFPMGEEARFPAPALSTLIEYTAGYLVANIPPEIRSACKVIASSAFLSRRADISVTSESLGDYSYARASGDTAHGIMQELLGNWREIR